MASVEQVPIPQVSPRERYAAGVTFLLHLEETVEHAVRLFRGEAAEREKLQEAGNLVFHYLETVLGVREHVEEMPQNIELEDIPVPVFKALVFLCQHIPEFYAAVARAPVERIAEPTTLDYNPLYVALQESLQRVTEPPSGEDPKLRRRRGRRVRALLDIQSEHHEPVANRNEPYPLDTARVTFAEIKTGAGALLELLESQEALYVGEEEARRDAELVKNWLRFMYAPADEAERTHDDATREKYQSVARVLEEKPGTFTMEQIPKDVFEAALRLKNFEPRLQLGFLGHTAEDLNTGVLDAYGHRVQGLEKHYAANPFNVAARVTKNRFEQGLAKFAEVVRLDSWESAPVALQGGAIVLANAGAEIAPLGRVIKGPLLKRFLAGAKKVAFTEVPGPVTAYKGTREALRRREADRNERVRKYMIAVWREQLQASVPAWGTDRLYQITKLVEEEITNEPEFLRAELMESVAEALMQSAKELDPAYGEYLGHLHSELMRARDEGGKVLQQEWSELISKVMVEAAEHLVEVETNRFYYPDQIPSLVNKKNYERVGSVALGHEAPIVEMVAFSGGVISVDEAGEIVAHSPSEGSWIETSRTKLPPLEGSIKAFRFLSPNQKRCVVQHGKNITVFELRKSEPKKRSEQPKEQWEKVHNFTWSDANTHSNVQFVLSDDEQLAVGGGEYKWVGNLKTGEEKRDISDFLRQRCPELLYPNEDKPVISTAAMIYHNSLRVQAAGPGTVVISTEDNKGQKQMHVVRSSRVTHFTPEKSDVFSLRGLQEAVNYDASQVFFDNQFYVEAEEHQAMFDTPGSYGRGYNNESVYYHSIQTHLMRQMLPGRRQLAEKINVPPGTLPEPQGDRQRERRDYISSKPVLEIKPTGPRRRGYKEFEGVTITEDVSDISCARVGADGKVFVGRKDGTIDIYDGEPVEVEPIEERLQTLERVVAQLANWAPGLDSEGDKPGRKIIYTPSLAKFEHGSYAPPREVFYGDEEHQEKVKQLASSLYFWRKFFDQATTIADTPLKPENFKQAKAELGALERLATQMLVAITIADDALAVPAVRLENYAFLKNITVSPGIKEYRAPNYREYSDYELKRIFGLLSSLRGVKEKLDGMMEAARFIEDVPVVLVQQTGREIQKLVIPVREEIHNLAEELDAKLQAVTDLWDMKLEEKPLSASVNSNGQLKPDIQRTITDAIMASKEIQEKYDSIAGWFRGMLKVVREGEEINPDAKQERQGAIHLAEILVGLGKKMRVLLEPVPPLEVGAPEVVRLSMWADGIMNDGVYWDVPWEKKKK